MNGEPTADADARLDPLVRRFVKTEIRKIVEKGPGRKATEEMQASSFDRKWFDQQAKILKTELEGSIVLPETFVNGQGLLDVVREAYAGMKESHPCVPAETFHLRLQASYSGDQPLTFQPPVPMGRSNAGDSQRFPTPGMSDLSETFGEFPPLSGARDVPYGNPPPDISRRWRPPRSSIDIEIGPGHQAQGMYQTEGSFQTYGMSHGTQFENIPDDMLFAPSLEFPSPAMPEGSGFAHLSNQQPLPSLPENPLPLDPDLMIDREFTEAGVQPSQGYPPNVLPNIQLPWAGQGTIPFDTTSRLWPENDRIRAEIQRSYAEHFYSRPEFGPPSTQGPRAETSTSTGGSGGSGGSSYAAMFSAPPPSTDRTMPDPPMYPPGASIPPTAQAETGVRGGRGQRGGNRGRGGRRGRRGRARS